MVFDLLYRAGRDLSRRPLRERRQRLEELVAGAKRIVPVRRLADNGLKAWEQVLEQGYEGMVTKDEGSAYEGGRTKRWLKVKVPWWTDPEDRWHRVRTAGAIPRAPSPCRRLARGVASARQEGPGAGA